MMTSNSLPPPVQAVMQDYIGQVDGALPGLLAGVYPAWRVCRIPPAVHLKLQ